MILLRFTKFGSLDQKDARCLVEKYCDYASFLPVNERMLLLLYYRDGYSSIEISQLLMKHNSTVLRRIHRITKKLERLRRKDE